MLPKVGLHSIKLENYRQFISGKFYQEIQKRAHRLKGLRVVHLNATSVGGGVAEILKSLIPLMANLGLRAEWKVIPPKQKFFEVTKKIHNSLQGKKAELSDSEKKLYLSYNQQLAKWMRETKADIWIIHDPQPLATISYLPSNTKAVWRCHIDTSTPFRRVWAFIKKFLGKYQAYIFSLEEFSPAKIDQSKVFIIPPAIDPLSPKNQPLNFMTARMIISGLGINPDRPLVTQISRFDPWKDPIGVIRAYYLAKNEISNLQLALVGLRLAKDDPEAMRIFKEVKRHAHGDPDIFLFSDPHKINIKNAILVNAFQTGSEIIIQKSVREGFGLTVAEAMWKAKPVIGGAAGGIKKQIEDGRNGFLVSSPKEAAARIVQLLRNKELAQKIGKAAKKSVRKNFLIPRLLNDWLKVLEKVYLG